MSGRETRPWLLVSDIDDTLTGDDEALARLAGAIAPNRDRLWFAVNSSRPVGSVRATLDHVFPADLVPDAVITALGTEIAVGDAALADWETRFADWPHDRVFEIVAALGYRPHDPAFQTPRKVSFDVPGAQAQERVRDALAVSGIPCQVIVSGRGDFDIIPEGAGKDAATLHLAATFGCDLSRVIAAGDSGNDLAMFRAVGRGIAVANARQELLDGLGAGSFYLAREAHAGGVLEGLVHFGVLCAAATEAETVGGRTRPC